MASWPNYYMGIPYQEEGRGAEGCDCYGLVRLVQLEQRGIDMPELLDIAYRKGLTPAQRIALGKTIQDYDAAAIGWDTVPAGQPLREFDVVWLKHGGPIHFGVMVDGITMLHIEEGAEACTERIDTVTWASRVLGVYRHA